MQLHVSHRISFLSTDLSKSIKKIRVKNLAEDCDSILCESQSKAFEASINRYTMKRGTQ